MYSLKYFTFCFFHTRVFPFPSVPRNPENADWSGLPLPLLHLWHINEISIVFSYNEISLLYFYGVFKSFYAIWPWLVSMTLGIGISLSGTHHPSQPQCMLWSLAGCAPYPLTRFSYFEFAAAKSDKYDKMVTFSIYWYLWPRAGHIFWENWGFRNPEQNERGLNYRWEAIWLLHKS